MTLNGVVAFILHHLIFFDQIRYLWRPIMSQLLKIDLLCLQNIVFNFWPKLTHPAARSLCDSWATCYLFTAYQLQDGSAPCAIRWATRPLPNWS